jgi:HEXXH motif-containing protein
MVGTTVSSNLNQVTGHGLVLPEEGDAPHALKAAYARYLVACCRRFLAVGSELPAALRPAHAVIAALVQQAVRYDQRRMLLCFASPTVGTPLQCLHLRDGMEAFRARIDTAAAAMLPHLLLEMALRGLIPDGHSVLWEHGAPRLASLALGGELVAPRGSTGLRFTASHVAAVAGGAEVARVPAALEAMQRAFGEDTTGFRFARRFWPTGNVARFATIDHNPIAEFEAHPDKAGNPIDLGGRAEAEWIGVLDECFALVERFMPSEFAEMRTLLHAIVPVGYHDVRHLSASYREAIGTIYLTLHPQLMTMAEAVVHEFQHNKLNVAAHSVEFLVNAMHPLYKSPVRPDPRPLWGILLAVHAFLPVAELYRRMRDGGHPRAACGEFEQRLSDIDQKNHEGMEMLRAHAQFTPAGRAMFDELEALERRHLAEPVGRGQETALTESHDA